jgi:HK97 family phage prohead protease
MTHPSIEKARAILAKRGDQEKRFAEWRKNHADELDNEAIDELLTRRLQSQPIIRKISAVAKSQNGLEFTLSDETVDRMGDVIVQSGWQLDAFQRNPVALFSHDPNFVIGRWQNVRVQNNELRGHLHLAEIGMSPRVDEVVRLTGAGLISAASVGFRVLASEPMPNGGRRFTKSELSEVSLVSQPANANCLAIARSLHISDETIGLVFEEPVTELDELADEIGIITGGMQAQIDKLQAEIRALKNRK